MELGRSLPVPGALLASIVLSLLLFWLAGQIHYPSLDGNETMAESSNSLSSSNRISDQSAIVSGVTELIIAIISPQTANAESDTSLPSSQDFITVDVNSSTSQAASESACDISPQFPNRIRNWCTLISENADQRGIDPDLLAALIWQESGGNPSAYSSSGAVGLMQVMPRDGIAANFQCPNGPCFKDRPTISQLQDPEFNIRYGARMLSSLIDRQGSVREALRSYGPTGVGYYYADKVLGIYRQYNN